MIKSEMDPTGRRNGFEVNTKELEKRRRSIFSKKLLLITSLILLHLAKSNHVRVHGAHFDTAQRNGSKREVDPFSNNDFVGAEANYF